jgi:hypothetical protein
MSEVWLHNVSDKAGGNSGIDGISSGFEDLKRSQNS